MRRDDAPPPRRKSHRRYLLYRAISALSLVLWLSVASATVVGGPFFLLLLMPLALPGVLLISQLFCFRWSYSVFGAYERTPEPDEAPILVQNGGFGGAGIFSVGSGWPFCTWRLYRRGLGFTFTPWGSAYLTDEQMRGGLGGSLLLTGWLGHRSTEVRNPLLISKGRVLDALRERLQQGRAAGAS